MITAPIGDAITGAVGQRSGPRRDGHRRADRHVRPHRRSVAAAERVLPLPPARRRNRRLGRPDRRHGRRERCARGCRVRRTAPRSSRAQTFTRSVPTARCDYRHEGTRAIGSTRGTVLAGVTPTVLARLLGEPQPAQAPGAQVKVNLMLRRLPRLRDESVSPEQAFGGTFHINENLSQLDAAYDRAARGGVPDPLPCEIYCHSLTDPTILSEELRGSGAQTLTVFGLHTPHHRGRRCRPRRTCGRRLTDAVLASLDSVLAEPIRDVVMNDAHGRPCIEAKTTADLEDALGMTAGNIFHGALRWPFAEDDEPLDTAGPALGRGDHRTTGSCCAARLPAAAARCRGSAATTPRWRCWRASRADELGQDRLQRLQFGLDSSAANGRRRGILDVVDVRDHRAALVGERHQLASAGWSDPARARSGRGPRGRSSRRWWPGASMVAASAICLAVIGPLGQPAQHPDPAERQARWPR